MKAGDSVKAIGLVGAAHLNGRRGVVVQGMDPKTGRVAVQFEGEDAVKCIKPQNLVAAPRHRPSPCRRASPRPSIRQRARMREFAGGKVGRNDKCPCGSGRKYKKCCEGKALGACERQADGGDGGEGGGGRHPPVAEKNQDANIDYAVNLIFAGDAGGVRRLIDAGLNANAM